MKKTIALILVVALSCVLFTACGGGNSEKAEKIQASYAELVELTNKTTDGINAAMEKGAELDQAIIAEYNKATEWIAGFGEIELDGMSDEEMDEILEAISTMKVDVSNAQGMVEAANDVLSE